MWVPVLYKELFVFLIHSFLDKDKKEELHGSLRLVPSGQVLDKPGNDHIPTFCKQQMLVVDPEMFFDIIT